MELCLNPLQRGSGSAVFLLLNIQDYVSLSPTLTLSSSTQTPFIESGGSSTHGSMVAALPLAKSLTQV